MSLRVLSVFGTRPEAIKMGPLVVHLARDARFTARVCVTGQHRRMLDRALELFGVVPDHDLDVMAPGQDLHDVTARVLLGVGRVLAIERPDVVLVHGDTTSCLSAALSAFYHGVPIGHVEAGLRSHDPRRPFPEEMNRVVADRLSSHWFAPSEGARRNLLAEGAPAERIHVTGNTGLDALRAVRTRVAGRPAAEFSSAFGPSLSARLDRWDGRIVLVTGHRRESFGQGFADLCAALHEAARRHRDWLFVYPVHLNPEVQAPVRRHLGTVENIVLTDPLDYVPFVWLMNRSDVVLTDSGGIQEEAPALGKPVLVTREVTERPEALAAGTARLIGTDRRKIVESLEEVLLDLEVYAAMSRAHNPYGDGHASERIADALAEAASDRASELVQAAGGPAC